MQQGNSPNQKQGMNQQFYNDDTKQNIQHIYDDQNDKLQHEAILSIQGLNNDQHDKNKNYNFEKQNDAQICSDQSQQWPLYQLGINLENNKFSLQNVEEYIIKQYNLLDQPSFERTKSFITSILYAKYNEITNIIEKYKILNILKQVFFCSEQQLEEVFEIPKETQPKETQISAIIPIIQSVLKLVQLLSSIHHYENVSQWSDLIQDETYLNAVRILSQLGDTWLISQEIVEDMENNSEKLQQTDFLSKKPLFTFSNNIKDNQFYVFNESFKQVQSTSQYVNGKYAFIMNYKGQKIDLPNTLEFLCIQQTDEIIVNAADAYLKQLSIFNGAFIPHLVSGQLVSLTLFYAHNVAYSALTQLSNLKYVYLDNILFSDSEQQLQAESSLLQTTGEKVLNLISCWPNMNKIAILNCQMPQTVYLNIKLPLLQELIIHDYRNLERLQINTDECQCSNLTIIDVTGELQIHGSLPLQNLRFVNSSQQNDSSQIEEKKNTNIYMSIQSLLTSQKSLPLSCCASQLLQSFDPSIIQRQENIVQQSQLLQQIQSFAQASSDENAVLSLLIVELYEIYQELGEQQMVQYFVLKIIVAFMKLNDEKLFNITNLSYDSSESDIKQAAQYICGQILVSECSNINEVKLKCEISKAISLNQIIIDLTESFQQPNNVSHQNEELSLSIGVLNQKFDEQQRLCLTQIGLQLLQSAVRHCCVVQGAKGAEFFAISSGIQSKESQLITEPQSELKNNETQDVFVWDANNEMHCFDLQMRVFLYSSYLQRNIIQISNPGKLKSLSLSRCGFQDLWQCTDLEYLTLNSVKHVVLSDLQYLRKLKGVVIYDVDTGNVDNLPNSTSGATRQENVVSEQQSFFDYLQNSKGLELLIWIQDSPVERLILKHEFTKLRFLQLYTPTLVPLEVISDANLLVLEQINMGDADLVVENADLLPSLKFVTCGNKSVILQLLKVNY